MTLLPGWRRQTGANVTTLTPPGGGGRIRIHDRLPLVPVSRLVAALAGDASQPARVLELATVEGEHAVLASLAGRGAMRHVGVVLGDDFAVGLDALVVERPLFGAFEHLARELLARMTLGLGTRPRRFFYQPPPGWQALPNGLAATWYPPDFPADSTSITVLPATPVEGASPRALFEELLGEEETLSTIEVAPFSSDHGLDGQRFRVVVAGPQAREVFIAVSPAHSYVMRLDTHTFPRLDEHRTTFLTLARSARRLPGDGAAPEDPGHLSGFWAD